MEKQLKKTYQQTKDELEEKWFQFMKIQGEKVKAMQDEYYAIKKTGDSKAIKEYGKKLGIEKRNLTLKNAYYKEMVDETTTKLAQTNQIAVAYINNQMPDIYAINFNDAFKNAVKGFQGISYTLVDEHTVRDLIRDNRLRLPKKSINKVKDKRWNAKQLNSSILQGILQGESIDDMASRILPVVDNNMTASYRTARTMTTNCENKGRQDRLDDLSEQGLDIEKTWLATDDERTRESHMLMDGETVPYDEEFSNGLMYPADENGDPSEVYNCRCTMTTNILGWKKR